ncbi:S1C family serine protease [Thermophilibacter sp.]|uniref:S1C family serine protease n=1 Tax=Thermophilibacter sp. TaxID=2847309 RepID=UPI003A90D0F8
MTEYPYGAPASQGPSQPTEQRPTPPAPGHMGDDHPQTPPNFSPEKPKKEKKPRRTLKTLLVGLLGGVLGAGALTGVLMLTGLVGPASTQVVSGDATQQITIDPADEDTTVANAVAAKALPSVVTVYCTFPEGEGMGSGVIYDTDGNIITNNHVIEDAESISVSYNGKSYDATLVGTDPSSDVAVIHVDFGGDEVTPIEHGDSDALQVGDWVMSVGSPFGLENSVSQGIVSALSRSTLLENSTGNTLYTNLIQTDATINPGNSGGALVDAEGKLVGICTLFSSDTESFAGIGYAIPGNYAMEIADKVIAGETVTHAYIGLSMQTVTAANALRNGLSVDQGAYVVEVTEGSPAAEAGIEVGDVITSIDGESITSADGAILAVRSHDIGDTVEVVVMRGDQERTFEVTLGSDEALQQEQSDEEETVNLNGQEISVEDLMRLYEQYQQERSNPFGR